MSPPTKADGTFTLLARPGKANVYLWQLPDEYDGPNYDRQSKMIDIKDEITLEPIRVQRTGVLEGVAVDRSGNPVAGAEIRHVDTEYGVSSQAVARSDAAGRFAIKGIVPKKTYIVRVRTDRAAAEPVNVVLADLKGPLRVTVSEKLAFTLRGTVTGQSGKPAPQAQVGLVAHWQWGSSGTSFRIDQRKTDEQGRFEFGGLWPGDNYQICIRAKDCVPFGSAQVKATPGGTHDFGPIALASAIGVVAGRVLDSAGQPVADARVFNSGDGIALLETRSDAAGRFRLQGFRTGPVFVFAEKEGYRFAGLGVESGAAEAVLKMLKTTEPPPRPASIACLSGPELRKAAKQLLEKLWAGNENYRPWACSKMARVDPELARKWAAAAKNASNAPQGAYQSPYQSLDNLAEQDLDEALSVVDKNNGSMAYYQLNELARHFLASDPEKATRCVEEGVVRARSLDQPQRALGLAQMAALAMRWETRRAAENSSMKRSPWPRSGSLPTATVTCSAPSRQPWRSMTPPAQCGCSIK